MIYYFYTDSGVFSKGELDFGTELLLKTFEYSYPQDKKVLDIGCGCGPIGIYLSKLGFAVDMCDVNLKAIELSKKAIVEQKLNAEVYESDAYLNVNNKYDYIISNPPYSLKGKVFKRLFEIGKPFAMLVGVVGLFESEERFSMFANNDFEIMYLNKRVSYFKDYAEQKPSLNPPFSSVYVCKDVLPKQIVFERIEKNGVKK